MKESAQESAPGSDDRKSSPTTAGRAEPTAEAAPNLEATLARTAAQLLSTVNDSWPQRI